MSRILLCSSNPLLVKSLYGMIRDQGYEVEEVEHPALAVQRVLGSRFDATIIDAEPFGLSAKDAACIMRTVAPEMAIFCVGAGAPSVDPPAVELPAELDAVKELLQHVRA